MHLKPVVKRVWSWLKSLFQRQAPAGAHPGSVLDEKLGQKILRRKERQGRLINTRQFGPHMPKRQPCPLCRRRAKRKQKTMGGAHYYCGKCKHDFFIRAR